MSESTRSPLPEVILSRVLAVAETARSVREIRTVSHTIYTDNGERVESFRAEIIRVGDDVFRRSAEGEEQAAETLLYQGKEYQRLREDGPWELAFPAVHVKTVRKDELSSQGAYPSKVAIDIYGHRLIASSGLSERVETIGSRKVFVLTGAYRYESTGVANSFDAIKRGLERFFGREFTYTPADEPSVPLPEFFVDNFELKVDAEDYHVSEIVMERASFRGLTQLSRSRSVSVFETDEDLELPGPLP